MRRRCLPLLVLSAALLGGAPPRDPEALRFADEAARARFEALREHAARRAAGWRHRPLRFGGNFVQERWCGPGVPARACDGGAVVNDPRRGAAWFDVGVLHYPQDWPRVFGLVYHAGDLPAGRPWGLALSLALDGRRIVGEHVSAQFLRFEGDDASPTDRVPLGDVYAYAVEETTFRVAAGDPLTALRALAASPDALRATATGHLDALLAEVRRGLAAHEARKCVRGPYRGGGVPPECTLTPLAPEEEAAWAARAATEIGRRRALVEAHAAELHALLAAALPAGFPGP